jgi:hypothetical protein
MTENLQDKAEKTVASLATTAPHWVCLLLLAGSFLWYLDRKDSLSAKTLAAEDLISRQRIDQCHRVQADTIQAMAELQATLKMQTETFRGLAMLINDHLDSNECHEHGSDTF